MRFQNLSPATALLCAGLASALDYADNQAPLQKDEDHIAANFPDVEGVELLSPAFANPDSVPSGFTNGTDGPTDIDTLGKSRVSRSPK
jgi:hypothetical protein